MNVEKEEKVLDRMSVLYEMLKSVETNVDQLRNRIYELEQENTDLRRQLKLDVSAKKGLFLHD